MKEDKNLGYDPKVDKEILKHTVKPVSWTKKIIFFLVFASMMIFAFWAKTNLHVNLKSNTAILVASITTMICILVVGVSFGTGTGTEIVKRFSRKFKVRSGKYVNTLFMTKNGVVLEIFKKVNTETRTFKIAGGTYIRNPALLFMYKGIPTYIHREGTPDPINVFMDKIAGEMSVSEMDDVMNSQGAFDLRQWLNNNKVIFIVVGVLIVGAACIAAYGSITTMQMLRDGTYTAIKAAAKTKLPG